MAASAMIWVGAVAVDWLPVSALLFGLPLVPAGVTNVLEISLVQALVPDGLLGRVTAVLGNASAAMTPVGALAGGLVAGATSATLVLWAAGASFALLAVYVFALPSLRQLPEISDVSTLTAEWRNHCSTYRPLATLISSPVVHEQSTCLASDIYISIPGCRCADHAGAPPPCKQGSVC